MATKSTAKRSIEVTLLRPDVGAQTLALAEGATIGDLLRKAGAGVRSPNVLIDGLPIEEAVILKSGMTITINGDASAGPSSSSRQTTVGMFSHPAFWREVIEEGRAIREADRRAASEESDGETP